MILKLLLFSLVTVVDVRIEEGEYGRERERERRRFTEEEEEGEEFQNHDRVIRKVIGPDF